MDGKFSKISANSFCTQRGTASALAVIAEGAASGDSRLISALSIARKQRGASRVPIIGELLMVVACWAAGAATLRFAQSHERSSNAEGVVRGARRARSP
jgi:hypothetical protein